MIHNIDPQLTQWDVGRSVTVSGTNATHIHFANQGDSKAVIMEIVNESAKIPDYLLQTGKSVIAYAVLDGVTLESKSFPVRKRERPENYVYEDDQRNYIYELIASAEDAVESANQATASANTAAGSANIASTRANEAATSATDASAKANLAAKNANEATTKTVNAVKNMMVVGEAKGESIAIDNAIDQTLVGLRVFGKTTQNGTPTPDEPVELVSAADDGTLAVNVCGKNLFTGWIVGGLNADTGADTTSQGRRTEYLPCASIPQISVSGIPATLYSMFAFYDASKKFIGRSIGTMASIRTEEIPTGAKYFRFSIYENPNAPGNVAEADAMAHLTMIVVGNTATEYEQGKPIQTVTISTPNGLPGIPVTSGGNYTDANGQQWECDEIDYSRGVYIQRYCQVALNGNEQWNKNDGWMAEWTNYFTVKLANNNLGSGVQALKSLCSHFKRSIADVNGHMSTNYGRFCFNTNISSITEWKEWLAEQNEAGKPITLVYPLDTPIETPLSEEELAAYASLHTYKDNTTVSNDAGAWMDLEYVMDAKKYINSLVTGGIAPATIE